MHKWKLHFKFNNDKNRGINNNCKTPVSSLTIEKFLITQILIIKYCIMKSAKGLTVVLLTCWSLLICWTQKNENSGNESEKKLKSSIDFVNDFVLADIRSAGLAGKTDETNITLNYAKLLLSKDQYDSLSSERQFINPTTGTDKNIKSTLGKNIIVFQFAYLSDIYPYPTLRAYPMRVRDQRIVFGLPIDLGYQNSRPLPDLSVCGEQVTGDMQIAFSELELLKEDSNPKDRENYQYFLFTPKLDGVSQHVYFEVSVFPYTGPGLIPKIKFINPSPPHGG